MLCIPCQKWHPWELACAGDRALLEQTLFVWLVFPWVEASQAQSLARPREGPVWGLEGAKKKCLKVPILVLLGHCC